MKNLTIITEFLLLDIFNSRELQIFQGLLFLLIYLGAMTGNLLTIIVTVTDQHLHFPMYFFIGNLSFIDVCYISVTIPKSIVDALTGRKLISLQACAAQIFLLTLFASTELAFLVVMSYDRYIAICHPLHYGLTVTPHMCAHAVGGSWVSGLIYSSFHTGIIFSFPFTGSNVIHQFFCDIPQILSISSSEVQLSESALVVVSFIIILLCFLFLFISYINIFSTVLKIRSAEVRNKALSTCTPQLATLFLFVISGMISSFGPVSNKTSIKSFLMAMFYTTVPPSINPIIFGLRNREINIAISRMFNRHFEITSRDFLWLNRNKK